MVLVDPSTLDGYYPTSKLVRKYILVSGPTTILLNWLTIFWCIDSHITILFTLFLHVHD